MKQIHQLFKKKENEETWELFDQALKNIKIWATVDKIHQYPGFVDHIKLLQQPIISALNSERTRLAGSANELLQGLSKAMQRKYELIHELFLPTLIKLFSRTNKLHVRHTMTTFKTIVENSKVPRTTHRLCLILRNHNDGNNNNKAVKYHVTECLNTVIQVNATSDLLRYVDDIQDAIRNTAMDPAPEVRSSIRMCYKLYCEKIPTHASK
ncbi:clasp N-terminal domain-containing protein [Halteromyces radiatus]|uniref:clasp N-terminal domain-containing protein n=1 Tax=Halteromyces radiatus TaxID=101107 RepID=UPI00221EAEAB|nr:clasp N-terminal domain-containing protein [Halteromyces radiatus]KAI8084562.1 clasp N-terminal domain-containing protein [Halteromyces radiatus]